MAFYDEFTHLKIQLEDIKSATDNFADNKVIGCGGFGNVYKGEISHSKGKSMAAFKCLNDRSAQGNTEFWREIMMLSRYAHENLVSLLGYCNEDGMKVLVYEYASRGSLDRHLSSHTLTWAQRLRICLAAARGLSYLHDHQGTQQRVLHRDIKSSNILLDENWNAKISDLGLSKIGPANQPHTLLVSDVVGTLGYIDPMYLERGFLTKESDVYSFGVVLFEVMCGRLCYDHGEGFLVHIWKQSYEEKKLDDIIFRDMKRQMDPSSSKTFSDVAYECLLRSQEERPKMAHVVKKLKIALKSQVSYEEQMGVLLSKEIPNNRDQTWFSVTKNGKEVYMLPARATLEESEWTWQPLSESRFFLYLGSVSVQTFTEVAYDPLNKIRIAYENKFKKGSTKSQTVYASYLVYKLSKTRPEFQEPVVVEDDHSPTTTWAIHLHSHQTPLLYQRTDGWMEVKLWHLRTHRKHVNLTIYFANPIDGLIVQGIQFKPYGFPSYKLDKDYLDTRTPFYNRECPGRFCPPRLISWSPEVNSQIDKSPVALRGIEQIECPIKMNETTISSSGNDFQDQDPKAEDIRLDRESPFHCIFRRHITTKHKMKS
ncbi:hypothetical protein OSB04_030172 [Centaurea solstitialis]|uniref:non-specific serine/threonine protein kinase n=1 Tax=Centaurea solstitialis TaxID=347529 RepID=A0AA38W4P8_9ASTR|nr:hypothetical protein OSB04_030172 [Centaurea solstitialis]